ncbi:type II toxin-antitoxin system MqsA family antitoxin [bacterium]|nr:type II toxin-antitoxin system MqsA family antitoxin [bacterium]
MICDICGHQGARSRQVTRSYGKGKNIIIIENVPVITCSHCGESYLTADTLHEIERIKLHKSNLTKRRQIPVAIFG